MSHLFRFLAKEVEGESCLISGDEFFHLKKVLRLSVGEKVEVFDGVGSVGSGEISSISSSSAEVSIESLNTFKKSENSLSIGLGALKPKVFDELLPGLCEVGIDRINVFLQPGVAGFRIGDKKTESRWKRIILNASKQCKRTHLPVLHSFNCLSHLIENSLHYENRFILSETGGASIIDASFSTGSCIYLVGGEKGFTSDEINSSRGNGFHPLSLGQNILRAKTAALVAGGIMSAKKDKFLS